jgi:hypothetical protein
VKWLLRKPGGQILIGWPILFVTMYRFVMLAIAGITVPGARVVGVVGTAIALISSILD